MFPVEDPADPVPDPAAGATEGFCVPVQPAIASAAQMRIIIENVTRYCIQEKYELELYDACAQDLQSGRC